MPATGDVTAASVRWHYDRAVPQLPSPLLYRGILYMVNDGGIITALEPETGRVLGQRRLAAAADQYYASPVAADGRLFVVSAGGIVSVLAAGPSLDVLAANELDAPAYATPALADGQLFVRTASALYCFGETPPSR